MRVSVPLVSLVACAGGEEAFDPSPANWVDAVAIEGIEALTSVGAAPHRGTVRAVNRFGAAVPSGPQTLTVGGVAVEVGFDGAGYGGVVLEAPGAVDVSGANEPARWYTVASTWPGAALHDAWAVAMPQAPEWTGALTQGMASASGSEVWWAGDGAPPHRVLVADAQLLGFRTAHIDVDGVTDAVAWTATTVYLLKGRANGGMGWGGALRADGLGVGGVDIADLSEDNLPDVAIAWVDVDGSGVLDVWEGDGLFDFEAAEPRDVPGKPVDLIIGDNTGEGVPQITVMHQTGSDWTRFVRGAAKQYLPVGPFMPAPGALSAGSRLLRAGDINDDGADELGVVEPRTPGAVRRALFFDLSTDAQDCLDGVAGAQCQAQYVPIERDVAPFLAVRDGNLDRVDDVWILDETEARLYAVFWSPERLDRRFAKVSVLRMPEYAPIDALDVDLDGSPELHLAGASRWRRYRGRSFVGDPDRFWEPLPGPMVQVREAFVGPFALAELAGDTDTIEVVGASIENGRTHLRVAQYTPGGGRAPLLGSVELDGGGDAPSDLAVCGTSAWIVVAGRVHRVDLSVPTTLRVAATVGAAAQRVDCGAAPGGATAAFVQQGEVVLVGDGGGEVATVAAPGAQDVAIGDLGAGPAIATCDTPGCTVVSWPYGSAGEAVFAVSDADDIRLVDATGAEASVGGGGALSVGDLDGDGHVDLLGLTEDGLVSLHRSTGGATAPLELWHTVLDVRGPLLVRDGDGDGHADLWAIDALGDLKYTQPPAVETATTSTPPSSTGDTGVVGSTPTAPTGDTGPGSG